MKLAIRVTTNHPSIGGGLFSSPARPWVPRSAPGRRLALPARSPQSGGGFASLAGSGTRYARDNIAAWLERGRGATSHPAQPRRGQAARRHIQPVSAGLRTVPPEPRRSFTGSPARACRAFVRKSPVRGHHGRRLRCDRPGPVETLRKTFFTSKSRSGRSGRG